MEWLAANDYVAAREILQRGVALVYLIAFISTLNQFRALAGERGLLPVPELLAGRGPRGPTLFSRIGYSDNKLVAVCAAGIVMSAMLLAGLPQAGPPWLVLAAFLAVPLGGERGPGVLRLRLGDAAAGGRVHRRAARFAPGGAAGHRLAAKRLAALPA